MQERNARLLMQCIGKTIKAVTDTFDGNPASDDCDGFIIEFTDGTTLEVGAMSDKDVGVVGVSITHLA